MVLGRDVLLEVLRTEGVTPRLRQPRQHRAARSSTPSPRPTTSSYVLGLQEATVVGMADGYAQATGRPAFLNLHTSAGLGNAIGNLTNARANRTPLVVTAGQQDYRHIVTDPLLSGPLVELAGGTVKWGHEVRTRRRARHDPAPGVPRRRPPAGGPGVRVAADGPARPGGRRRRAAAVDASTPTAWPGASRSWPTSSPARRSGGSRSSSATRWPPPGAVAERGRAGRGPRRAGVRRAAPRPRRVPAAPSAVEGDARPGRGRASRRSSAAYDRVLLDRGAGLHGVPVHARARRCRPRSSCCTCRPTPPSSAGRGRCGSASPGTRAPPSRRCCRSCEARADACGRRRRARRRRPTARAAEVERARGHGPRRATAPRRWTRWPPPTPSCGRCRPTASSSTRPSPPACTCAASTTGPSPAATSSARAAGSAGACRPRCGVSLGHGEAPVLCVVGDGSAMYSPQALWTAAAEQLPGGVRGGEQPPVQDPQGLPAGHGRSVGAHRDASSAWTSTTRRSTSSALARSMARGRHRVEQRRRRRRRRRGGAGHRAPARARAPDQRVGGASLSPSSARATGVASARSRRRAGGRGPGIQSRPP